MSRNKKEAEKDPFMPVEPYLEEVVPSELLSGITDTINRYIICSLETAWAATLWIAFTWFVDSVNVAPIALITAPEKRCGKSQLLTLLCRLVARPLMASNITPAALFRSMEKWSPTLLIDEADTFLRKDDEMRGIINAGHTRDSATVIRLVGDKHEPKAFNVWGAKAIAGIGHQADTIMDRSIVLELRRKLPHENVERLRHADDQHFRDLQAKLARFAQDYGDVVAAAKPELPEQLNDRAQDNWEPLLAIADIAGGSWPENTRKAALKISFNDESTESINTELLADIQEIFVKKSAERIGSSELIKALCEDEDKPWATFNRGFPIKPSQIAKRLKGFGITSKNIRASQHIVLKGYEQSQFREAFERYLTQPENDATTATELQPSNQVDSVVAGNSCVADIPAT